MQLTNRRVRLMGTVAGPAASGRLDAGPESGAARLRAACPVGAHSVHTH